LFSVLFLSQKKFNMHRVSPQTFAEKKLSLSSMLGIIFRQLNFCRLK
jgi:hypothetical protein